ncbi:MAG: hypothetical protein LBI44_03155 [Oscillospiraceae bacterium]|jgi:hypothetical protein|nr:hypothetical protein [Oscillospiraceae bacterium]
MKKTVIFALILSLLLALAACAGGSSPSPSAPANSPSPSQPTPSTPASPSDSPSPSPSPSPSEAEPSPSIDPALSKDGKFRAQSTLTEDPRTTPMNGGGGLYLGMWNNLNIGAASFEKLKQQNEMGFKELYDVFGLELNEDKLYDIIYGKYKWQYDKFMALLDSEHKDTRDLVNFYLKYGRWSYGYQSLQQITYRGKNITTNTCYEMIADYIRNDKDDLDNVKYSGGYVPVKNSEQSGNNFILYNLDNPKLPNIEIISARAYTEELAKKHWANYRRGDEVFVLVEIDDIPVTYLFSLDGDNNFSIEYVDYLNLDCDEVAKYYTQLLKFD